MLRPPPALLWRGARCRLETIRGASVRSKLTVFSAVSTGIKPMLTSNNLPLKRRAQDVFLDWTDQCDFEGLRDFYGFQADLLRNVLIDGESLVLMTPDGPGAVPLQLRLLGPEYLDRSRVIVGKVLDGIEYDATGRRVTSGFIHNIRLRSRRTRAPRSRRERDPRLPAARAGSAARSQLAGASPYRAPRIARLDGSRVGQE